jgi:pimeloyl-ACP methyl ester carboxylesterase
VFIVDPGFDRRIWGDQVRAFAKHYQVVRYDLRGWGRSPRRMGVYRHAEDLAGLLDSLGIERAALVGFREGGEIALDLALERPELVAALVLVEPKLRSWLRARLRSPEFDAQVERLMAAGTGPNPVTRLARFGWVLRAMSRQASRQAYAPDAPPRWTWRRRWANLRLWANFLANLPPLLAMGFGGPYTNWRNLGAIDPQHVDPQAPCYFPRLHREPPVHACLGQVVAPTLLVRGTPAVPLLLELDAALQTGIAGTELARVADAPNFPHMIRPGEFNRVVLDFLQGVYPPR